MVEDAESSGGPEERGSVELDRVQHQSQMQAQVQSQALVFLPLSRGQKIVGLG